MHVNKFDKKKKKKAKKALERVMPSRGRRTTSLRPALTSLQVQITEDYSNSFLNKQRDGVEEEVWRRKVGKKERRKKEKGGRCSLRAFTFQEFCF